MVWFDVVVVVEFGSQGIEMSSPHLMRRDGVETEKSVFVFFVLFARIWLGWGGGEIKLRP